jgi:ribonuclease Z
MKLVFIGTGGSWPTKDRNLSSVALKMNGDVILFDCAEGTQRQLFHSSLNFMHVNTILLSHFHGDHFLGLPGLIQSMYLNDRKRPLYILGPEGTTETVRGTLSLGYFSPTFDILTRDLSDGDTIDHENYTIRAKTVDHDIPALAYAVEEKMRKGRFHPEKALALGVPEGPLFRQLQNGEEIKLNNRTIKPEDVMGPPRKGRKVVYSGDTRPSSTVIELAKDSDVLIHDSTFAHELEEKAISYGHSTTVHAAKAAKEANVKVLFLTHISPRYDDGQKLEDEAKEIFQFTFCAYDFLEYDIQLP